MICLLLAALLAQADPAPLPAEIDSPGLARTPDGSPGTAQQDVEKAKPPPPPPAEVVEEPPPPADESAAPPGTYVPRTFLSLSGVGGLGAGLNIIPFPAPYAGPWGGFGLELERKVGDSTFFATNLDLSLGSSESGRPIGGYQLLFTFGNAWINSRFFVLQSELHGGVTSVLLIPLPLLGGITSVILQPFRGDVFRLRLGVETGLDFILIIPIFTGAVYSEARWDFDRVFFAVKAGGAGSLSIIAPGVSASVKLTAGLSF